LHISWRKLLALVLLYSPSLAWFYIAQLFILNKLAINLNLNPSWEIFGQLLFFISIIFSAIIGSNVSETYNRKSLLQVWIISNIIITISVLAVQELDSFLFISVLAGFSFGFGYPSCSAFFADSTMEEERARVAGLLILITFFLLAAIIAISSTFIFDLTQLLLLSIFLRGLSIVTLLIDPCERYAGTRKSWLRILRNTSFLKYLFPWIIFNTAVGISALIDGWIIESPNFELVFRQGQTLMYIGVSISAIVSGFFSDSFGRKKTIIFGLATLGISYALLGLATTSTTYLFTKIAYGSAWGILMVNYGLTVTGDLASKGSKEKFFAFGVTIPLILTIIGSLLSEVLGFSEPPYIISAILSILLFISVVPLLSAPETLPEDKIRDRKMKRYVQKLKELISEDEN
jgi:MFS family permease